MKPLDTAGVNALAQSWLVFGRHLAVAAGASTALLSLLFHRSLTTACLRGAIAYCAAWVVTRLGHWAIMRTSPSAIDKGTRSSARLKT
jgi:hypothetical protein